MKRVAKTVLLGVIAIMSLGVLTACIDYARRFHYDVVGEHGVIEPTWGKNKSKPLVLMGSKNSEFIIEFVAIPDEGYQVKEWTFNGEIVEGNKTNSFIADGTNQMENYITVEFEPIP